MSRKEGLAVEENSVRLRILFSTAVALVFVTLIVSMVFSGDKTPTIKNGASTSEIAGHAYALLQSSPENSMMGYDEAVEYYNTQIAEASSNSDVFNLKLDLARFYLQTGDPDAALELLDGIAVDPLPLDARYYLYASYIAAYQDKDDVHSAESYAKLIETEGINEYFAALDDGAAPASPTTTSEDYYDEEEDYNEEDESGDYFEDEELL